MNENKSRIGYRGVCVFFAIVSIVASVLMETSGKSSGLGMALVCGLSLIAGGLTYINND